MTRLGPLTAQALGRSPFDDVVEGEGDDDPRAPAQQYDGRGRPINPETKKMNKDMIRAHNEVMQVIGVAEPDNMPSAAEIDSVRRYIEYEETTGSRLLRFGRALEIGGVWGVNGLRQRILLYKQYSDIPFYDLYKIEMSQRSLSNFFLAGLPTFLAGHAFKMGSYHFYPFPRKNRWLNGALAYVRVHLQLYVFLQRLDIIPTAKWFPSPSYFLPGSPSSPIPAPPPLKDFSMPSLLQYFGGWCINAAPFAAFVVWGQIWTEVTSHLWQEFYGRLPNTVHHRKTIPPPPPPVAIPETPEPRQQMEETVRDANILLRDLNAQVGSEDPPVQAVRRPSAFSARGDEYGSDEEEEGGVSATLISFDVEATDSADAPPGLWSAELRPSAGPDNSIYAHTSAQPTYLDTMLTRLPACLASDIFTVISGYVLVAPYEAIALRLVARSYRLRMGLPIFDMHSPYILSGLTWRGVTNFVGLEFFHLLLAGELWALVTILAHWFHMTEEEWKLLQEAMRAEAAEERRV